jgi:hypothetical protein
VPNHTLTTMTTMTTLLNLIHKANCHVFVSLRAECPPQDHAMCIDNDSCLIWEMKDPNQTIKLSLYSYSNHIQSMTQQANLPSPIFLCYGI